MNKYDNQIPFEADYEDIKNDPNAVYEKYSINIRKTIISISMKYKFDYMELLSLSYLWFSCLAEKYNPYYNDGFIPFNNYLFANLCMKTKAYINRELFKTNREPVIVDEEIRSDIIAQNQYDETTQDVINYLNAIPPQYKDLLILKMNGYKQWQLAKHFNISQSRISVLMRQIQLSFTIQYDKWPKHLSLNKKDRTALYKAKRFLRKDDGGENNDY